MTAQRRERHSVHRWIRKALPRSVVVLVVSADTTVRTFPDDYDGKKLRAMLTPNGGDGSKK
jgi:hypothetical protein